MILETYKNRKPKSKEEKHLDEIFASYCLANGLFDHMTDEEINKKFKKMYT